MNFEFDGRKPDLAIGVVRGVRAFNVDDRGRLIGINFPQAWRPGENLARCLVNLGGGLIAIKSGSGGGSSWGYAGSVYTLSSTGPVTASDLAEVTKEPAKHAMAKCAHGFYAYYDGSNDYRSDARISAVVEGYGETFIGTRGFRCEKARIVALCMPRAPRKVHWSSFVRFFQKHGPLTVTLLGLSAVWAGISFVTAFVAATQGDWVSVVVRGLTFALAVAAVITVGRAAEFSEPPKKEVSPEVLAKIRANYPDVPTFSSFAAMIAAYPPDRGLASTPTSDPNFWE